MKKTGLIQLYTGDGKGKTTAAIGLAIRASGQGKKVVFLQFLKSGDFNSGEEKVLKKLKNIKFIKFNEQSPVFNKKLNLKYLKNKSEKNIEQAIKIINSGKYDIVILDEITHHFKFKTIKINEFFNKIKKRPDCVEIVITGRWILKELINKADLVTEMKNIKHPFDKGIFARKGIEY